MHLVSVGCMDLIDLVVLSGVVFHVVLYSHPDMTLEVDQLSMYILQ